MAFPLSPAILMPVLGGLPRFVQETRGEASFLFQETDDSRTALEETLDALAAMVDDRARATVSVYVSPLAPGGSLLRFDHRMIVTPWSGLEPEEVPSLVLEQQDEPGSLFAAWLHAYSQILRKRARLRWTNRL